MILGPSYPSPLPSLSFSLEFVAEMSGARRTRTPWRRLLRAGIAMEAADARGVAYHPARPYGVALSSGNARGRDGCVAQGPRTLCRSYFYCVVQRRRLPPSAASPRAPPQSRLVGSARGAHRAFPFHDVIRVDGEAGQLA